MSSEGGGSGEQRFRGALTGGWSLADVSSGRQSEENQRSKQGGGPSECGARQPGNEGDRLQRQCGFPCTEGDATTLTPRTIGYLRCRLCEEVVLESVHETQVGLSSGILEAFPHRDQSTSNDRLS